MISRWHLPIKSLNYLATYDMVHAEATRKINNFVEKKEELKFS
jgi:hypothetical protein